MSRAKQLICSVLLAMTMAAGGIAASDQTNPMIEALVPGSTQVHSTEEVMTFLLDHDFEWPVASDTSILIVPRIVTNDLPSDWEHGLDIASRKSIFIRLLAPLILIANEQINADRTYILDAMASGHAVELRNSERYKLIVTSYGLSPDTAPLEVLKRVDIIPPALAIAQAILESGWGTSRFAAEGNALYGEWMWGGGMQPMRRDASQGDYGVRDFSSLLRSALSYMQILNTSHHYQDFRTARMDLRLRNKSLDACTLAKHLAAYAAIDGTIYRKVLCDLIVQNDLHITASAVLASTPAVMLDFRVPETFTAMTTPMPVKDVDVSDNGIEADTVVPFGMIFAVHTYLPLDVVVRQAVDQVFVNDRDGMGKAACESDRDRLVGLADSDDRSMFGTALKPD